MSAFASKEACGLHQLLPRVLQHLAERSPNDSQSQAIDSLMGAVGLLHSAEGDFPDSRDSHDEGDAASNDFENSKWQAILLEALGAADLSHAEINQKRKSQTFAAFKDLSIVPKIEAVEDLVTPNMNMMRTFFERSDAIARLQRLPHCARDERVELCKKNPGPILHQLPDVQLLLCLAFAGQKQVTK